MLNEKDLRLLERASLYLLGLTANLERTKKGEMLLTVLGVSKDLDALIARERGELEKREAALVEKIRGT